jgi:hypothetical protein
MTDNTNTTADSGQVDLQQIGRAHLQTRASATPTAPETADRHAAIQEHIAAAQPGARFTAAVDALAENYGQADGSVFILGDGQYGSMQAASLLGGIGFSTDAIVEALDQRLDETGGIQTFDFADALAELTGDRDAAAPYLAAGHASRDATAADPDSDGDRDAGTYHPSINIHDYLPTHSAIHDHTDVTTQDTGDQHQVTADEPDTDGL